MSCGAVLYWVNEPNFDLFDQERGFPKGKDLPTDQFKEATKKLKTFTDWVLGDAMARY